MRSRPPGGRSPGPTTPGRDEVEHDGMANHEPLALAVVVEAFQLGHEGQISVSPFVKANAIPLVPCRLPARQA
jgi:hypothetical protein